jgi:hypothetical protein
VPSPAPSIRFIEPAAEQVYPLDYLDAATIRISVTAWALEQGRALDISLDAFSAQRIERLDPPPRLVDLIPPDRDLQAGEHVLFAAPVLKNGQSIRAPTGQSFALVRFWIGDARPARIDLEAPMLFLLQPRGTYNGATAASNVLLDFYLINALLRADRHRVRARLEGPAGTSEWILSEPKAYRLGALESGDYRVKLDLLDPAGKTLDGSFAHAARAIVVNRDAPLPPP